MLSVMQDGESVVSIPLTQVFMHRTYHPYLLGSIYTVRTELVVLNPSQQPLNAVQSSATVIQASDLEPQPSIVTGRKIEGGSKSKASRVEVLQSIYHHGVLTLQGGQARACLFQWEAWRAIIRIPASCN